MIPLRNPDLILSIVVATLLFLLFVIFIVAFLLIFKKRRQQFIQEKQHLENNFQQELLKAQLEIQEQTFKNISQEIHDNIGQVLTLAKLKMNTTLPHSSRNEQEKMEDTKELISKAIQDLRDLSKRLNTDYLNEQGLIRSIQSELDIIERIGSVKTKFEEKGIMYQLPPQKELIIFRIFQEAVNNIMKHSGASNIIVSVNYKIESFIIEVGDDGVGFDVINKRGQEKKQGIGLKNMENRSRIIGATYNISSSVGKGTVVQIILPL